MKKVYALKNSEKELMKSSSGGAFIAICNVFEKKYGKGNVVFYGACFDKDLNVTHNYVTTLEDCKIFQGSKYVKSNYSSCLKNIENNLNEKKAVLFSGTPCQVFAIKTYLNNKKVDTNKLLCVDIICHGTPKKQVWDDYKKWLEKKEKSTLINYSFRYKPEGWKAYPALAEFINGNKKINTAETSVYSKLHMLGYTINEGCFSCQFSNQNRYGDITLGDYWGIENINSNISNKNGVSLVITNTDNGDSLLEQMKKDEKILVIETKTDSYIKYQHNLKNATERPKKYEKFWEDYNKNEFEIILKKYLGYGKKYIIKHNLKRMIRKTPLIKIYRKIKSR